MHLQVVFTLNSQSTDSLLIEDHLQDNLEEVDCNTDHVETQNMAILE